MKEEPVDRIGGKMQRFPEIDEQDHARIGSVVPGLVLIRVIENDRKRRCSDWRASASRRLKELNRH
jgi:hypothetical protein